jgi:hypothetical protein
VVTILITAPAGRTLSKIALASLRQNEAINMTATPYSAMKHRGELRIFLQLERRS